MKKVLALAAALIALPAAADQWVNGYTRHDGTYVPGYYRTEANNTRIDNYSSRPNVNPYTGERGYIDPYATKRPELRPYEPYRAPAPTYPTYEYKPYVYEPYTPYRLKTY